MPKEQTTKRKVKLQRIRSDVAESKKTEFGTDTAVRSYAAEKTKIKAREEAKRER